MTAVPKDRTLYTNVYWSGLSKSIGFKGNSLTGNVENAKGRFLRGPTYFSGKPYEKVEMMDGSE